MAKHLTILQWNSRSINANKYSLVNYLRKNPVDIILLSETWLKSSQYFDIKGFNCVRRDREDGKAGVAILISDRLSFTNIKLSDNYNTGIMACAVQVALDTLVDIMVVYKPPSVRASFLDWFNLFQQCNTSNCIIGGDFNIHSTCWGSNYNSNDAKDFVSTLDEFDLIVMNDGTGTHITYTGGTSAIDLSLVSSNLATHCEWNVLEDTLGSDHFPIVIESLNIKHSNEFIYPSRRWIIKDVDWCEYAHQLESYFDALQEMNAADMYNYLLSKINLVAQSVMKVKKPFLARSRGVCWWDNSCSDAINRRKEVLRMYRSEPTNDNFIKYKKICAETKRFLKMKARNNWKNFCEQLNRDTPTTKIWQAVRSIKRQNNTKQSVPDSVLLEVLHRLTPDSAENQMDALSPQNVEHVLLQPFTINKLNRALNNNTNTSPGYDNVLYPMIKNLPTKAKVFLINLFNKIYLCGEDVRELKTGIIVPITKRGKRANQADSIRPISLLSCIFKTLERLIKFRFEWWAESYGYLPLHQYGFRKGLSTQHALAHLVTDIQTNFTKNNYLAALFIDLKDAYNHVNLHTLRYNLEEIDIPVQIAKNIVNLFTCRHLVIRTRGNEFLGPRVTSKGLAQGSVLSPFLYNVYTRDLQIPGIQILQYADDIVLYSEQSSYDKCIEVLNTAMKTFLIWCDEKEFQLSISKCSVVFFTRHRIPEVPYVILANKTISVTRVTKYLGIWLDSQLKWRTHIIKSVDKCQKANNTLRLINKISFGADFHTARLIYRATVRAILDYGCIFYGSACKTLLYKLDVVNNNALRICLGAMKSTPVEALYSAAREPPLSLRRDFLCEKFILQCRGKENTNILNKIARLNQHNLMARYWSKKVSPPLTLAFINTAVYDSQIHKYGPHFYYLLPYGCFSYIPTVWFPVFTKEVHHNKQIFFEVKAKLTEFTDIYTDGAKNNNATGYAFYVPSTAYCAKSTLPAEASVFTAEALAIKSALQYILQTDDNKYAVFSDSKSVLLGLNNTNYRSFPIILEILHLDYMLHLMGKRITYVWVKGHSDIRNNEIVDLLAKSACNGTPKDDIQIPYTDFLLEIRQLQQQRWQDRSDGTESPILEEREGSNSEKPKQLVKYGELVILGYNGFLPQGDRGRKRSKFVLYKRQDANGVKRSRHYEVKTPHSSQAILDAKQHSISYTLSRNHAVIVEYTPDENTDMFQIGRSSEAPIDFVVMDTIPGEKTGDNKVMQSTISRFACRILADRNNPKIARIYAAGFDTSRNIFLGEKASKWRENGYEIDGLTTNGVLIMHPKGSFCGGEAKCNYWLETSVGGGVHALRESRSAQRKGQVMEGESNILQDGTLIDLCGATLLWRSAEGLAKSPSKRDLEREIDEINAGRPQCPVGLNTLVIPRKVTPNESQQQPYVYLNCGHVQGHHDWGQDKDSGDRKCPICLELGPVVKVCMGLEPAFYVDSGPPTYAFNPCGHMATEKTVKYWASVAIPHGTNDFYAVCPFCASPLSGNPGYVKLIFQDNVD